MFVAFDGIVFDVLLLNSWDQNAIWSDDGTDFLYWHHLIDVTVVINPNVVAADVMPGVNRLGANKILKQRKLDANGRAVGRENEMRAKGLLPKSPTYRPRTDINVQDYGVPSKSPIVVPGPQTPQNSVPDANGQPAQVNSLDNIIQTPIPGVQNYPTASMIAPGVPYAPELAVQTSPLTESIGGTWTERNVGVQAAPATIDETITAFAEDPVALFAFGLHGDPQPPAPAEDGGPPNHLAPPPNPGQRARFPGNPRLPATDIELRDRLQVPRRRLSVWVNSGVNGAPEFIINLPYDGCTTDALNGPKCVDQNMVAVHGNVTGIKRLVFECHEALPLFFGDKGVARLRGGHMDRPQPPGGRLVPQDVGQPNGLLTPPIMSNRWTMRQIPDQTTHLNSMVIEGKAIFRMDILGTIGITADQLRQYIMPPVASGYVRRPPQLTLGSVGNEIYYSIIDDQQMLNNPAGLRWGVHSVTLADEFTANNPVDMIRPVYLPERK